MLLSIFQRYKMKANHNIFFVVMFISIAVVNISKIQNESKSQHFNNCLPQCDHISKIQNESKSQHV